MPAVKFVDLGRQYIRLRKEITEKFDDVSKSGAYVLGENVAEFEELFARYCGTRFAVGVGSGSDALYMSLFVLGIGPDDEVVTPPNSFVATVCAIVRAGARPVFCDVGDDMNIAPDLIETVISKKTKAILPVHLTGRVADMDGIRAIAEARGLFVVEDAAQAAGASYKGRRAGSFGVCAGFSLHPLKNLHVHGDGGVITTDDAGLYAQMLKCRNHGLSNRDRCEFWGINSRLDTVQAGIATIKLKYLDEWNERFREIAAIYTENLAGHVSVPTVRDHEKPIYHRYMIRHSDRDGLQRFLAQNGIETRVNYPIPLHLQPAAAHLGYKRGDFPMAEKLADTILSLPIYAEMETEQVHYVIEKVIEYCREHPCRLGC